MIKRKSEDVKCLSYFVQLIIIMNHNFLPRIKMIKYITLFLFQHPMIPYL